MDGSTDPRLTGEFIRQHPVRGGELFLVGVVHDHPASKFRVTEVIERVEPDVLALELPPIAVPLYEQYAKDERTPPAFGGEMSTAIQAACTGRVVGIDGPSPSFAKRLLVNTATETDPRESLPTVLRSLFGVARQAAFCRLAAAVTDRTGLRLEVDPPVSHDCEWTDDPATQADAERRRVQRAGAVTELFEQPDTVSVRKDTRDQHMSRRLESLRSAGDIVAVVGIAHLDPIADELRQA